MMGNYRTIRTGALSLALSLAIAVPLLLVAPNDASAQAAVGYVVPSLGTAKGATKVGRALRGSLNAATNSVRGRAVGGTRVAGVSVSGIPMARGRSAANVAGIDKYGRPDKRYTGQRCESIEAGVRVIRGC